jgi:hypothetical protein
MYQNNKSNYSKGFCGLSLKLYETQKKHQAMNIVLHQLNLNSCVV